MPRRVMPDEEGYVYFARSPSGYLYGPYANRGTAAGVSTAESRYAPERRQKIYVHGKGYVDNPDYDPNARYSVVKAKLGPFEDAPKLSLRDRLKAATARIRELEARLNAG